MILPTRNRSDYLRQALDSILTQTLAPEEFEIIVVDNASTDDTRSVVAEYQIKAKFVLKYQLEEALGLHNARHAGVQTALFDTLVFADDDIEADPAWLEAILESFTVGDAVLVGGKNLPKFEGTPPSWLKKKWENPCSFGHYLPHLSILDLGEEIKRVDPYYVFGCNFAIRKEVLIAAGGFHPDSMPKEVLFLRGDGETHICQYVKEQNLNAIYNPKATIYHHVPVSRMEVQYFLDRAYNQGISDSFSNIRRKGMASRVDRLEIGLLEIAAQRWGVSLFNKFEFLPILDRIMKASYINGFNYHNTLACEDDQVLNWVLKETWLT